MTQRRSASSGLTLIEIVAAIIVSIVIMLGIMSLDTGRFRMENELRSRGGLLSEQAKVGLAALNLAKALERADRINIRNTGIGGNQPFSGPPNRGDIQIRTFEPDTNCPAVGPGCLTICNPCTGAIPLPCCFDITGNYRWDEYKRDDATNQIWLYRDVTAACPPSRILAGETVEMTVNFQNEAAAPPGGEPFGGSLDNNTVAYAMKWDNGTDEQRFGGQITTRAIPYSNVNAAVGDSGWGQATGAVDPSPPPPACP